MLEARREQLVLAVLERPRPRFPREVQEQICEALSALVLQVALAEFDATSEAKEVADEGAR